jgi:hypothetical protein
MTAFDEAVDGRMRDAELLGDFRLRLGFHVMKHKRLIHLADDRDVVPRIGW